MKILVIGSGGREHAMVWKLAQSEQVEKVWAAPGNGGTAVEEKAENIVLSAEPETETGQAALLDFARKEGVAFTVVGPEAPLAAGIVDRFRAAGLAIVGPDKKAALLESSKVYSNHFMTRNGVRTAKRQEFSDFSGAAAFAEEHFQKKRTLGMTSPPLVIKADGLAAGKGVVIAANPEEAKACLSSFMNKGSLGDAGKRVVFEEFLEGQEVSVLSAVSISPGKKGVITPFIPARDHKRRFEGGKGPNTGGMGVIAPVPDFTENARRDFEEAILLPTLKGMAVEKMDYRGFLFFGLMVRNDQCYLLEYNARLGDPETQAVLPLMDSDFPGLCLSILDGSLGSFSLNWKTEAACAPVVVASGYPDAYRKGNLITLNSERLEQTGAKLFIAGAQRAGGGPLGSGLHTSGGRVFSVCALGNGAEEARAKAYAALEFVQFEGMDYRKDIGIEKKPHE